MTITGQRDKPYRVQTSIHLMNWTDFWSYTNIDGVTIVLDVTAANMVRQFYRVVSS